MFLSKYSRCGIKPCFAELQITLVIRPSVFFWVFFANTDDNKVVCHGSSKPGKRSFGRFSRPLLEVYFQTSFRYEPKVKSLAVAEIFRYCKGFRLSYSYFCLLDQKYKRGVMQHIFRQLPSRNGAEWTCVRLGDIFKKVSRRNTDGVIKNVITNSAEYGLIPQRDFFDKDIAVDGNTANYYVIENGDFVYNPRKSNSAPYGPFNRYTLSEQGIISPLYTCLVLQADISPSYLAWYFKSDAWYRYIYDNGSQGVRHDRVSMTDDLLMGIPVMYPSHVKQLLYADILDMVEARLQATQKTLDFLNKMRDGYMRQLFI